MNTEILILSQRSQIPSTEYRKSVQEPQNWHRDFNLGEGLQNETKDFEIDMGDSEGISKIGAGAWNSGFQSEHDCFEKDTGSSKRTRRLLLVLRNWHGNLKMNKGLQNGQRDCEIDADPSK